MESSSYPKTHRLRTRGEFHAVVNKSRIYPGRECLVRVLENGRDHPRLGIASPRQFGKAVQRNRFRRLVREAFRALQGELKGLDVMVSPRRTLREPTLEGVRLDLETAPGSAREQRGDRRRGGRGKR